MCIHFLTLCRARQVPGNRTATVSGPRGAYSQSGGEEKVAAHAWASLWAGWEELCSLRCHGRHRWARPKGWGGVKREGVCSPEMGGMWAALLLELKGQSWRQPSELAFPTVRSMVPIESPTKIPLASFRVLLKHCFLVGVVGVGGGGPWLLQIATSITFPSCSSLPSLLYFSPYHK